MSIKQLSIEVYQNKNVVENFDWYAVLTFFISFLSTIIGFLFLLKYVAFRLSKEKEKVNVEKLKVDIKPKRDIDELSTDSEFSFSEDDDVKEDSDIQHCIMVLDKSHIDGEEYLTTNYIERNINENEYQCLNDSSILLNQMLCASSSFQIYSACIIEDLVWPKDNYTSPSLHLDLFSLLDYNIKKVISLRADIFCDITNSVLNLLCRDCLISEETVMKIKAKNEQRLEECHCKDLTGFLMTSENLTNITKSFVTDIEENSYAVEKSPGLQNIPHLLFMLNVKCLKLLLSLVSELPQVTSSIAIINVQNRIMINKNAKNIKLRFELVKNRILEMQKNAPNDKEKALKLLVDHKNRIQKYLTDSNFTFLKEIQSVARFLHNEHQVLYNQLLNFQVTQKTRLTQEVMSSNYKKIDEFAQAYGDNLLVMHSHQAEEFTDLLLNSCKQESIQVQKHFSSVFKHLMRKVLESEETLFNDLQEVNKFPDETIFEVLNSIQKEYKELQHFYDLECNKLLSQAEQKFTNSLQRVVAFINETIKCVSVFYKIYLSSTNRLIATLPCISNIRTENLNMEFKEKLSIIAFNLACALVIHFLNLIRFSDNIADDIGPTTVITDLVKDIDNGDNGFEREILNRYLDFLSQLSFKEMKVKQHEIIQKIFSNESCSFISKIVLLEAKISVKTFFENQCTVFLVTNKILNDFEVENKEKSMPHLSRKGPSFVEKGPADELKDIYYGLLSMKETKLEDLNKSIENIQMNYFLPENDKNPILACVNILKKPIIFTDQDLEEHLRSKFEIEKQYAIDRFLKKINELKEKHSKNTTISHSSKHTASDRSKNTSSKLLKKAPSKSLKVSSSNTLKHNSSNTLKKHPSNSLKQKSLNRVQATSNNNKK